MALPCSDRITVDLTPGKFPPVCHASQFDEGRIIRIDFVNDGLPYEIQQNDSFELNVRKPDNTVVTRTIVRGDPSIQTTYCYISTTQQMVAVAGDNICEIKISDGDNNTIGTCNFIMRVEKSPLDGGVTSASAIHDLETQVEDMVSSNIKLADLNDIGGQGALTPSDGDIIQYNSYYQKWLYQTAPHYTGTLSGLDDTSISQSITNGSYLIYDSTSGKWKDVYVGPTYMYSLQDVSINPNTINDGHILVYDATDDDWQNKLLNIDALSDVNIVEQIPPVDKTGQVITWKSVPIVGACWTNDYIKIDDLSDVHIIDEIVGSSVVDKTGQVLTWGTTISGTGWTNKLLYFELTGTLTAGSTSITLTDTDDKRLSMSTATIDVYTDVYGVNPTSISTTDGQAGLGGTHSTITLTFEAQSANMDVKVRIS